MTVLKRVTQAEMKRRTGFGKALGYSFPEEDEILIRKDLPKDLEHEVLAHEEEHMLKGEEGPGFLDGLIGGVTGFLTGGPVGAVVGGLGGLAKGKARDKQGDMIAAGTQAQVDAANRQQAFAEKAWQQTREDQAPYREAGTTALSALMSMTGLGGGTAQSRSSPFSVLGPAARGMGNVMFRAADGSRLDAGLGRKYTSQYNLRYAGGPTEQGQMYNINEMGPENVYSGGVLNRNPNPMTIAGQSGYVQPNIQGRAVGGFMENTHYAGPPPGKPNPPWIPGGQPATRSGGVMNAANTTAVNPQTGYPNENPGGVEGGYNFMTEPGYQFRVSEGMRALDRGAAARGGLLSGGYGRKAIRYGQGFASNEFSNVYNRIANIAGLGQTSAGQSGQQGLYGAALAGDAASNAGFARASGYGAQSDLYGSSVNDWASMPWGDVLSKFKIGQTQPTQVPLGGGQGGVPFRGGFGSPSDLWG